MDSMVYYLTIGIGIGIIFCAKTIFNALSAKNWPQTTAKIIQSDLGPGWPGEGAQIVYKPKIVYQYTIGSQTYENDTMEFSKNALDTKKANEYVEFYHVGKELQIFVNPSNPKLSVVHPGVKDWLVLSLIICVVLFCSLLYMIITGKHF